MVYEDRYAAGEALARQLVGRYGGRSDVIVLGLPRGGVPVAWEVARALRAPLDVFLVRKLGAPFHEELAMGAIASGGVTVLNEDVVRTYGIGEAIVQSTANRELIELERRERAYRAGRPPPQVRDHVVIVVDDGLATGSTMRAAVKALQTMQPREIVVAVPVGSASAVHDLQREGATVVCLDTPEPFYAVGLYYADFSPTTDDEVRGLLARPPQNDGADAPVPPL